MSRRRLKTKRLDADRACRSIGAKHQLLFILYSFLGIANIAGKRSFDRLGVPETVNKKACSAIAR